MSAALRSSWEAAKAFVPAAPATTEIIAFRSSPLPFAGIRSFVSKLFCKFLDIPGMFLRLFGEFVGCQVISLAMGGRGRGVGVGREIVQFSESIVRALWHDVLLWKSTRSKTVAAVFVSSSRSLMLSSMFV
jgi:hypothetical protein